MMKTEKNARKFVNMTQAVISHQFSSHEKKYYETKRRFNTKKKKEISFLSIVDAFQTNLHIFILKLSLWMIFINRLLFKFDHLVDCQALTASAFSITYAEWKPDNNRLKKKFKESFGHFFHLRFFLSSRDSKTFPFTGRSRCWYLYWHIYTQNEFRL